MKTRYYITTVLITALTLILCLSINYLNADPGAKMQKKIIQSGKETTPYVNELYNHENRKQFNTGEFPGKTADMIAMDLSRFKKFGSFGQKNKQKFRGLKLQVRKDIDYKILSLHVREDIDYKILTPHPKPRIP